MKTFIALALAGAVLAVSSGCASKTKSPAPAATAAPAMASPDQMATTGVKLTPAPVAPAVALTPITGKISASSNEDANPAENGFDGDMGTRWCASDGSTPQWWRIDFAAPVDISGVIIHWEQKIPGYTYIVEGSTDGTNFTVLSDQTKNTIEDGEHNISFDYAAKGLKSFRITVNGLADVAWASFWEVEFKR